MATASKDYAAIAAKAIGEPSSDRPPRWCIYSRNKKGKTRFCLTAPNGLIIDPENGTDPYLKFAKTTGSKVWHIARWEDVDDVWGYLRTGGHRNHDWVSFDGGSRIHKMSLRWVMTQAMERDLDRKPNLIEKRDYGRAGAMMEQMFHNLNTLPIGVIYTAQERMFVAEEDEATASDDTDVESAKAQYVVDLPKGARAALLSIVDVIGRLYVVKAEVKFRRNPDAPIETEVRQQRRLWLEPHVAYDTGYRSEYVLPPFMKNPTVPNLARLIKEGPKK